MEHTNSPEIEQEALRNLLQEALLEAKLRNPSYSIRAFARRLNMSPAAVSEILNGKRRVSYKIVKRIIERLALDPDKSNQITSLFQQTKLNKKNTTHQTTFTRTYTEIGADQFKTISEWYHYALLSLGEIKGFKEDPKWIAKRLNITIPEATNALERLERLGLLKRTRSGKLKATGQSFSTPDNVANVALRLAHNTNLEMARKSLEKDSVEERDFTSMTMAIDPKKLPEAKKMVRAFYDQMSDFLESGAKKEVYKVCFQLFPLTNLKPEGKGELE